MALEKIEQTLESILEELKIISKSGATHDLIPEVIEVTPTIERVSATPTIEAVAELPTIDENVDIMGCPHDPTKMTADKQTYPIGHKLAGCFKKKRDKNYTEEKYLEDRRILIAAASGSNDTPPKPSKSLFSDEPPVIDAVPEPTPAPLSVNAAPQAVSTVPTIDKINPDTITQDEFITFCKSYELSAEDFDQAKFIVAQKIKQCGVDSGNPADISEADQAVRTWITKQLMGS